MFETAREELRLLRTSEPGERFQARYRRHRNAGKIHRLLSKIGGTVLLAVGLLLVPLPGPGWVIVALGVGLLGGESLTISSWLDRRELQVARVIDQRWRPLPRRRRRFLVFAGVAIGLSTLVTGTVLSYHYRDQLPLV